MRVALVLVEAVLRVALVERAPSPRRARSWRGSRRRRCTVCEASPSTIALAGRTGPRAVRCRRSRLPPGATPSASHGAAHGEHRGVEDVDAVDLLDAGEGDGPGDGALLDARRRARSRRSGVEHLGVGEAVDRAAPGRGSRRRRRPARRAGPRPASSTPHTSTLAASHCVSVACTRARLRRPSRPYSAAASCVELAEALDAGARAPAVSRQ